MRIEPFYHFSQIYHSRFGISRNCGRLFEYGKPSAARFAELQSSRLRLLCLCPMCKFVPVCSVRFSFSRFVFVFVLVCFARHGMFLCFCLVLFASVFRLVKHI